MAVENTSPIICDFCSEPTVEWTYPAHDIVVPDIRSRSVGAWAACQACHELIEADRRVSLARKSAEGLAKKHGIPFVDALAIIQRLHAAFYAARKGRAYRFG